MSEKFYRTMRSIARFVQRILYPLQVEGRENLYVSGGAMIVCNHVSLRDPIAIGVLSERPIRFMGKKELFKGKLTGKFLRAIGGFPVDRDSADLTAIRLSARILSEGDILCVFPQGHRFPHDESHQIKNGAALLAIRSGAPVIPIHIQPPYRLFRKTVMRIGTPVKLDDLTDIGEKSIQEASRRIVRAIWNDA